MPATYIVSAKRTPIGSLNGSLKSVPSPKLGAVAIKAAMDSGGIQSDNIDEVIMGNVLTAGVGQAPARQAAMLAGIPIHVGATTINKVCGSAMKALIIGHDMIQAGSANCIVVGGMESMSNAPHLVKIRNGVKLGSVELLDHLLRDGLDNADGRSLGIFSENTAAQYGFTKKMQDDFIIDSAQRAQTAQKSGAFCSEIAPVTITSPKSETIIADDEGPLCVDIENIHQLEPLFGEDKTITSATSSEFSDGAAALVLVSEKELFERNLFPLAKVVAYAGHAHEPENFITAPIGAIRKALEKAAWEIDDVDLFELNEAVAPVPMSAIQDLKIPPEKMNINGGACTLGHPIGASGARIIVTLIHALAARSLKRGVAAICIGGGEGLAVAIEIA